jgi:Protein of unknown function (DUF3891)
MIVRETGSEWLVVTQADHARLASDLLALLRLPGLADHPRRDELLADVAPHDDGWWESDAAPRIDPQSGRPLDFLALDPGSRFEIWDRGVERHAARHPYRAAMIATHALRLFAARRDEAGWSGFLDRLEARRDELLRASGRSREELAGDDRWLELADDLSLAAVTGSASYLDVAGWRAEATAGTGVELRLAPFPLAGTTRRTLRGRRVPARAYGGDAELAGTLARARWESFEVRVAPLEPAASPPGAGPQRAGSSAYDSR